MGHSIVVDDDQDVRRALTRLLHVHGIEAVTVGSGEAMIAMLATQQFDWALIDVHLPGMDGFEVVRLIRDRDLAMKAILMTGWDQPGFAERARRVGAVGYLLKPIKWAELVVLTYR